MGLYLEKLEYTVFYLAFRINMGHQNKAHYSQHWAYTWGSYLRVSLQCLSSVGSYLLNNPKTSPSLCFGLGFSVTPWFKDGKGKEASEVCCNEEDDKPQSFEAVS